MRRVSSRTLALKRAIACGAMRRRGSVPLVKLKPRNLRTLGLATALLALLTLSLRRLVKEPFDAGHHPLACPLTAHIDVAVVGVAHEAVAALSPVPCPARPASGSTTAARAARLAACLPPSD